MTENLHVFKVGSAGNFDFKENRLNTSTIEKVCKGIAELHSSGKPSILIVSGAVPIGMREYGFKAKPEDIDYLQMCASYGQPILVATYQRFLKKHGLLGDQVLVTYEQFRNKEAAKRLRRTLEKRLLMHTVPVINYDDANDPSEVRSDNDQVGLEVAVLTEAKHYVMLTEMDGLMKLNDDGETELVREIRDNPLNYLHLCSRANSVSGGGMVMKLEVGAEAQRQGITTYIGSWKYPLTKILRGDPATIIHPLKNLHGTSN